MQRVSALLPIWDRSKPNTTSPKAAFFKWPNVRNLSLNNIEPNAVQKYGREHYWPTNLDRECEKAARILQSFCYEGYVSQDESETKSITSATPESTKKRIPPRIIQNAVGLAIFSCMRSGLWMSGSGGSGILIARKSDGSWSPPSGFLLHTAALAFVIGVDIYDCVLVINSVADLEMFTRPRVTLGIDVHLAVGPVTTTGTVGNEVHDGDHDNTVLTYLKAKGQHRAVNIDGSHVTERGNENERFYGSSVAVLDILAGDVSKDIPEIRPLYEAIKAAEGRVDFDVALLEQLAQQPAPGDATIVTPMLSPISPTQPSFGIPNHDDPDPYGVIALEMAGLEIREAGAAQRPVSRQFEYTPSPTTPNFSRIHRESIDTFVTPSYRGSTMSDKTSLSHMTDAQTQTGTVETRGTTPVSRLSVESPELRPMGLPIVKEPEEMEYMHADIDALENQIRHLTDDESDARTPRLGKHNRDDTLLGTTISPALEFTHSDCDQDADDEGETDDDVVGLSEIGEQEGNEDDLEDDLDDDEEEPVIFEVATATKPQRSTIIASHQVNHAVQVKGALVTIPKRIIPPLPMRSPARTSRYSKGDVSDIEVPLRSPLRHSFQSAVSTVATTSTTIPATSDILAQAMNVPVPEDSDLERDESEDDVGPPVFLPRSEARKHLSEPHTPTAPIVSTHQRATSSVYTAILDSRRSMDDVPLTPSTWNTSGMSSVDDDEEHEPRTPRPDEMSHFAVKEPEFGQQVEMAKDCPSPIIGMAMSSP